MTETKHAPTPWQLSPYGPRVIGNGEHVCQQPTEPKWRMNWKNNAAFIVRACNSHDELVAALREAQAALDGAPNTVGLHSQINSALAKAAAP